MDEDWLQQRPDETREEWKARTFSWNYGRQGKFKDLFPAPEDTSIVSVDYQPGDSFLRQSEHMSTVRLECPEGFVPFQDSCIPEEDPE